MFFPTLQLEISRNHQSTLRELGRVAEVISQPCGPRKLAKAFLHCLRRMEDLKNATPTEAREADARAHDEAVLNDDHAGTTHDTEGHRPQQHSDDLRNSVSMAVSYPAAPPFDPTTPSLQSPPIEQQAVVKELHQSGDGESTPKASDVNSKDPMEPGRRAPHLLLVDDNKINRQLLVMFMKKCNFTYREAENGQEALDQYQDSLEQATTDTWTDTEMSGFEEAVANGHQNRKDSNCSNGTSTSTSTRSKPAPFDFVLMDISMPVRHIRKAK